MNKNDCLEYLKNKNLVKTIHDKKLHHIINIHTDIYNK